MSLPTTFLRVTPEQGPIALAPDQAYVVALTDWRDKDSELLERVRGAFLGETPYYSLPIFLVVVDSDAYGEKARLLIEQLADAGATILEPETGEESAAQHDPLVFAVNQYRMAMQTNPSPGPAPVSPAGMTAPSQPDGYQAFATAITKIAIDDQLGLFERRLPDGWQYDI